MKHPDAEAMTAWAEYVEASGIPLDRDDAVEVLHAWHALDAAGAGLHDDLAGCLGMVGTDGRCVHCGRMVLLGAWRMQPHKEGPGCLLAVPGVYSVVWLARHRTAIPVIGNLIYRRRRARVLRRGADPNLNGQHPV